VCSILTLGKQLSVCKCETVAKAHEIIAWLPMMDAAIAKINVGQNRVPEIYNNEVHARLSLILRILVHNEIKNALLQYMLTWN
jgi:hypothetical protein